MTRSLKVLAVAILVLVSASFAFAQEEEGGFDFGLSIGIGAETYDGEMWQTLKLSPDIAIGKFGIGLELTLNYQFEPSFTVRGEDWVPTGSDTFLDVYLPKFKYIRYGFKGDPLYAQFGSIEYALLGNGFIMGGYDNTLFLPQDQDRRVFGLSLDLDGALFNFPYVGIETFVGNLSQFDVLGGRLYVRPLAFTEIPIIKGLQVGGTLAMERKPELYAVLVPANDDIDEVVLYGADLTLPILSGDVLSLTTFADVAFLHNTQGPGNKGKGEMVGFGGRVLGFINYGAQIRVLGEDFIPNYFDTGYDLFREVKYNLVTSGNIASYIGWLGSLGFSFLEETLVFNATVDGPIGDPGTGGYLDWPHLYAVFVLGEGVIPNISMEAQFDKRSLGDPSVKFFDDSTIGARVNYSIGAAVLSFIYQLSYDYATGTWETKSGIESSIKLF
jgi:hypothetical protein